MEMRTNNGATIGSMIETDELICHECVADPFLKARVKQKGRVAACGQCSKRRKAVTYDDLKWWIDDVFRAHFEPGYGSDAYTVFAEVAGISEALATEFVDDLSSGYGYLAGTGKADDPYDGEEFVESGPDRDDTDDRWHGFQKTLRQEARFFNQSAEQWLDHIFTGLHHQRTWRGEGVILHVGVGEIGSSLYRARVAGTEIQLGQILANPMAELAPPPNGMASAGRMNAAGVSVFYGAVDAETCISEIRPPVGSSVVAGRFDLVRPVRLLDFDLLSHIEARTSHFDPDYERKRDRVHFLRAFGRQIARPILPGDEAFGYLPTQVVADYLAQRLSPPIDGMLYRSTQTGSKGRNIVLFNRASRVEPLEPHVKLEAHMGLMEYEDRDDSISLTLKPRVATDPEPRREWFDERAMSLRLDLKSIEVTRIKATRYEADQRSFHIYDRREPLPDLGF